jgi:myotubularin-related protein 1/2
MEKNKDALTKLVESQLFKGEELKYQLGNVKLKTEFHGETAGRLFITNYQCLFVEDEIPHHFTSVHLHAIHRVKKTSKSKAPDGTGGVDIVCKDFRRVTLRLPNTPRGSRKAVVEELTKYAFPPLSRLFAYSLEEDLGETNGWKLYDAEQEYARLGLDRDNWRLTTINDGHKFADTYPEKISIPASITDDKMKEAAKFRTHCRMIATVWKHPKNNATISRSSQPRRGLTGRRSQPDENLLDTIQKLNANTDTMYILDSRPKLNATANALTGGGYESTKSYLNTIREFAKIENIHDMRYSAKKLFRVCEKFTTDLVKNQPKNLTNTANTTDNTTNVEGNADNQTGGASNWWAELQATKYLDHIRAILAAANRLTELLDKEQASVLVHCSDGWDRTAQMVRASKRLLHRD